MFGANLKRRGAWSAIYAIGTKIMDLNKDFEELLHHLNSAHAKYLVVGAYAVIFYTEPRYTKDMDLWVEPEPDNAEKVLKALKRFGAPIENLTIHDLTNPDMVFQMGIEPNRIDILMGIGKMTFDHAWKNKRPSNYGNEKINMIDFDDLVVAKKFAGRAKDKLDLEALLATKKKPKPNRKK